MNINVFVPVLLSLLLLVGGVRGNVHYYDFVLKETNFTRLCLTKSILTVNGSLPGPVIRVRKGDTVFVNVINQGDYGVTLHWHGVKQPRNPWSDGPEYITQCPIEPGSNFTYEVIFSDEEGTLWWHAHSDWTRATVHGAIVILPDEGASFPFPEPDGEEIAILGAWYKGDLMAELIYDTEAGTDLPHSDAYTINGQPGDFCNCSSESTYRWTSVQPGKTYLLRVINAVVNAEMFFAIAKHNLTIVGTDASYVKPFSASYIMIGPGQTIDMLVTANQSPGRYYMAARQYWSEDPSITNFDYVNATAILEYAGDYSPSTPPIFPSSLPLYVDYRAAFEFVSQFRSLGGPTYPIEVPMNVDTRMFITVSMNEVYCQNSSCGGLAGNRLGTSLNNLSWVNPSVDVLRAYYKNISGLYTTDFPDFPPAIYNFTGDDFPNNITLTVEGTKLKVLNYNETVEIVFQGTNVEGGAVNHPMHLHGYGFYVVGMGYGNFDNESDPKTYNLVDPPKVNTFGVPRKGWLAIRFKASNPGVWFWHCHLDRHMTWGMDTTFIVKDGGTPETSMRPPPPQMPPCTGSSRIFGLKPSHTYRNTN